MAQTVAIQRGTTTLTSAASPSTIYTQSGGNATRVIFNWVCFYCPDGQPGSNNGIMLHHFSSSGGSVPIGYYRNNISYGNGIMLPNQGSNSFGQWATQGTSSTLTPLQGITGSYGITGYTGSLNVGSITLTYPLAQDYFKSSFLPQNFWIGPSDTIKLSWTDNSGYTANVAWSFVTVTES
jgi:hypothetical protein